VALAPLIATVWAPLRTDPGEGQLLQAKDASTGTYSTALSPAATLGLSTGALGAAPE